MKSSIKILCSIGVLVLIVGCSGENTRSTLSGLAKGIKEYKACENTFHVRLAAALREVSINGSADEIAEQIARSLPAEEIGIITQTARASDAADLRTAQSNFDASVRILSDLDERFAAANICRIERALANSYAFSSAIRRDLQSKGLDARAVFAPQTPDASPDRVQRQILLALILTVDPRKAN